MIENTHLLILIHVYTFNYFCSSKTGHDIVCLIVIKDVVTYMPNAE